MRRRNKIAVAVLVAAPLLGLNAAAYLQARAMTHFSSAGARTNRPEDLDWLETAGVLAAGVNVPRPANASTPAVLGLPFEVHRFPTAHGPSLEAWYVPGRAEQPVVLLFHGYAASKSALLPVARTIHALGYATLLVDFYGSGGSSGSGTTLGYLEARDVAAAVDHAQRHWPGRRLVLYGFSMGGAAVLRSIAVDGVRPAGVILEATFDTLLNTAKNRFRTMGLPATPFAEVLLFWGGAEWGFDPFSHNPADYARAVTCPVLILHGEADARVPPPQAQALAAATDGARLVLFPGVAHRLTVTARPDLWNAEVGPFLARLE